MSGVYGKSPGGMNKMERKNLVIVRGGGDLATGTIARLYRCGLPVLVLETDHPTAIRRTVAFSEAVFTGEQTVEDLTCRRVDTPAQALELIEQGGLPLLVDPAGDCIAQLRPAVVVDAILAKKNLGTHRDMAPITIALGPGFTAGQDVDAVIETMRGHNLGRVLYEGTAMPNTGVPGVIAGHGADRVIHSPCGGMLRGVKKIGDVVQAGEPIAFVDKTPVPATFTGLLRGLIGDGEVQKGLKIADIDPRADEYRNCFTISDKARAISGGVLEALFVLHRRKGLEW